MTNSSVFKSCKLCAAPPDLRNAPHEGARRAEVRSNPVFNP
ncbi:hypothetical protein A2U01_0071197 [Trifolium medium]|uniref:Uncharacterized protein n=1 Tax=Trifolium medium TaxID=97028 RepID=A0A392SM41_9FABA|nr:hypothetical protein [Trifolium medium]